MSQQTNTPPKPRSIVRPGPSPQGPDGWEERRLERESNWAGGAAKGAPAGDLAAQANPGTAESTSTADALDASSLPSGANGEASGGGPLATVKEKLHKVGARLSLVEPRQNELGSTRKEAAHQNGSTMPE